jgi:cation:H+ antiporter
VLLAVASVAVGLAFLIAASDRLVASAVRISQALGVSAVLIGALVVGLGTSLPELLVSAFAAVDGELDVAMGNVVGSNIANVTLVIGAAALLKPISTRIAVLRREGVLMLLAVIGLAVVLYDGEVTRFEGFALLLGMVGALVLLILWSQDHGPGDLVAADEVEEFTDGERSVGVEALIGIIALAATVFGANLLLEGALDIGEDLGLSDSFLGVMLGIGTSLPELATAVAAARRSAPDLVVGNVLGSNLFNSLAVAGTAAAVGPAVLLDLGRAELWFMVIAVTIAGVFARTGKLNRIEGGLLLAGFVAFLWLTF